jgi:hypothetical protein
MGLTPATKFESYLQRNPAVLPISWEKGDKRAGPLSGYFVGKRMLVRGDVVQNQWTRHFIFHGNRAVRECGSGRTASPGQGGIIADSRFRMDALQPIVKFHTNRVPPLGTRVYVRLRVVMTHTPENGKKD